MPALPRMVWVAAGGAALLLVALCVATAYAVLRATARRRIAGWPGTRILALLGAAVVPWLIVKLAPIRISAKIEGIVPLLGWLAVALVVFALLVLLPLAAVLGSLAWWSGRSRRDDAQDVPARSTTRQRPVLVTGATGRVGRLVVDELLRAGVPVRALTRRPESAALPAGVDVVAGDLTIPASLDVAFEGVGAVFLVWTAAPEAAAEVMAKLVACAPSVRPRVVYLSSPHRTPHPFFQQPNALRAIHEGIERLLGDSGLDVAILRPGMFASNALHWWAPQIRQGDVVRWPYGSVETAPIDERDVAAVAARVLLDDRHANVDYVLTGPESLSQSAQVSAIGAAIGRQLRFEEVTPDEFRRETAATWPAPVVEMLLSAWGASLGQPAYVTNAVQDVLARPACSFQRWAAENTAAFARAC